VQEEKGAATGLVTHGRSLCWCSRLGQEQTRAQRSLLALRAPNAFLPKWGVFEQREARGLRVERDGLIIIPRQKRH
jgi:hypothetical protein